MKVASIHVRLVPGLLAALTVVLAPRAQDRIDAALSAARAKPSEMRWRLIPWHTSLKAGFAAAREANKPVFLFGYDGILDNGNC